MGYSFSLTRAAFSCVFQVFAAIILPAVGTAQNDEDALRYSQGDVNGSARFRAMGGAMGAMGADISCLNNNPAGIGVYRISDLTGTLGFHFANVNSTYHDSAVKDFRNSFVLPNLGISGAGIDKPLDKKHFVRSNFAFSLSRLVNYKSNISMAGNSRGSTMGLAFSAAAQGKFPGGLDPFYELPPFYYDLIDTVNGNATLYESAIPQGANNRQEMEIIEGGGLSELSFGGGYSYDDRVYGGWAIGIPLLNYTRSALYTETCIEKQYQTPNSNSYISSFTYQEDLTTTGRGVNLKLGLIYRFNEFVRAGLAYHSPSFIAMKDTYKSQFGITYQGQGTYADSAKTGLFKYSLITPQKLQASISVLLQKAVAMNLELEMLNYASMRLKSGTYFTAVDKYIRQVYGRGINLKFGVERNVKPVIFRAGYALYGGPYGDVTGRGARSTFSLGAGYKRGNSYIDLAYSLSFNKGNYYMYNPLYVDPVAQKFSRSFLVFTLGTKM